MRARWAKSFAGTFWSMTRGLWRVALFGVASVALAQETPQADTARGDRVLAAYLRYETELVAEDCLAGIDTLDAWTSRRDEYHRQFREMLGLEPWPERTPLEPVVTGRAEREEFIVENVYFQSRPHLYVTGNLYLPRNLDKPAPTILYVCGHGPVKIDGVSYGNKVSYQHHGAWFARHGFVCLTIDTLQLGEIEGIHHGTRRYDQWWWLSRGYTPAGVEAWNCVRALDYLETRPEVDRQRIGVTGRSGGGAYSWWIAALDDRVKVAAPVAGITDLTNHVVDGCVEGHCDCMYMVNTYRWDYAQVAALVAPRPLLLCNTDSDRIFPLDGVYRVQEKVRHIYGLHGRPQDFGLQISQGPHKDTQELQVAVFHWMNRHLKGEEPTIERAALKLFQPEELRVFRNGAPADEINTKIAESFVPVAAAPTVPKSQAEWDEMRETWLTVLSEKCFRAWPMDAGAVKVEAVASGKSEDPAVAEYTFASQEHMRLSLFVESATASPRAKVVELRVVDDEEWADWRESTDANREVTPSPSTPSAATIVFAPRGVGPTAFDGSRTKQVENRRRYYLLGQSLESMQVYDIRQALRAVRSMPQFADATIVLRAGGTMAGVALYAALFEPDIRDLRLELTNLPATHRDGPHFLNVLRVLDMPQTVGMVAEHHPVALEAADAKDWTFPVGVGQSLGWNGNFTSRP